MQTATMGDFYCPFLTTAIWVSFRKSRAERSVMQAKALMHIIEKRLGGPREGDPRLVSLALKIHVVIKSQKE